jgi:hypothetical protein
MLDAFAEVGNPSSVHAAGRAARRRVETARAQLGEAINAGPARIVFTGSGTEANAAALHGFPAEACLVSAIEHDCVFAPLNGAAAIPVDRDGVVDLAALETLIATKRPRLVAVMLANNETGVVQPIAEVARLLKEQKVKLPFGLYVTNSVQEEVGLRGAEMVANSIKPNVAIVTDVTHDTHTPMISTKKHGDVRCGRGPSVTYAPAVHQKLLDIIIATAEEKDIPFQREAASRTTGTDTDAFAYSNGGVPSALISLPLRYMHTTVEMAHKDDVNNLIRLIFESLQKIEAGQDFRYFSKI